MRFESFLVFFAMVNNQQKQGYSINLYYSQKHMSNRLVFIRNWEGEVTQKSSYVEQYEESAEQPTLVMYECLRSIVRKQYRYPFQLFKQYILFSDEQSSIEVGYRHMKHQLELIQVNLKAFCSLMRQKMLVAGFITIKHAYQKKLRVEAAYGNIENIECLRQSITMIQNLHHLWLKWQVFGKLYENYKGFKLSKINLSKIDMINNDYTSKQLMEFEPFLNDKIEVINSFIIDKTSEHHQQDYNDVSDDVEVEKLNIEKKSEVKQYAYKDDRLISQRSVGKATPATEKQSKSKQNDQLSSKIFVTQKKETDLLEHMSSNKQRKDTAQKQYIYLIRDYRQRKGAPTNYIKIPLNTQSVEIVEVHTEKKKKKKRRVDIEQIEMCVTEKECEDCKFCQQFRQRREIMKTVTQKLEIIRSESVNSVSEFRTDLLGQISQNESVGRSSTHYKSMQTAYSHREQFSAR